jgi:hypothetical protein
MRIRYYRDAGVEGLHIHRHGVSEEEVQEVFEQPVEDRRGRDGARVAIGRTRAGRYLRVVYAPDPTPGSVFVITAYPLGPKALWALRRRQRRRRA